MRELHTARPDPYQDELIDGSVTFEDLMRETRDCPSDGVAIEKNRAGVRHQESTKKPSRPEPGGFPNE
jgi:hypothetical protein